MKELPGKKSLVIILFISAILYALSMNRVGVGALNDDGIYIVCSHALVTGKGYSQIETVGSPPGSYPPGFSLLLAPFVALCYPHVYYLKLLSVAFSLCALYIVHRYFKEHTTPAFTTAVVVSTALNPSIAASSGTVMSDLPYLFFSFLTLHLMTGRESRQECRLPHMIFISILASYCLWLRAPGASLLLALGVYLAVKRKFRDLATLIITFVVCLIPLLFFSGFLTHYHKDVQPTGFLKSFGGIALANLKYYALNYFSLVQIPFQSEHSLWKLPLVLFITGLIATGLILSLRKQNTLLPGIYFVFYMSLMSLWVFYDVRFLIPVIPLLCYFLFVAVERVSGHRSAAFVCAVLIVVVNIPAHVGIISSSLSKRFDTPPYPRTLQWIRDNLPVDAIMMSDQGPTLYIYTGHRGVEFVPERKSYNMLMQIYRYNVDYIFFSNFSPCPSHQPGHISSSLLMYGKTIAAYPDKFIRVFDDEREGSTLFKVAGSREDFLKAYGLLMEAEGLYRQGNSAGALEKLDRCLERERDFVPALTLKAAILLDSGQIGESVILLEKAVQRDPQDCEGHFALGRAYHAAGKKDADLRELKTALALAREWQNQEMTVIIEEYLKQTYP